MNQATIEKEVRRLQFEIWTHAGQIFSAGIPPLPRLFEPEVAARICDYRYESRPSLGRLPFGNDALYETAGLIDHEQRIILVSDQFAYETQRFTGAHEIGHLMLHPGLRLHRDRPLTGAHPRQRHVFESEADYFAACFLAPAKLVRTEFEKRFGPPPKALTDTMAFHLKGNSMAELLNARPGSLDFAAALASADKYDRRRFHPLASTFGMSVHAMAIRLDELGLAVY